ncbi:Fic family protein [Plantibacter flavus]|uniref:Fic family protein n=1 Tax=Plantibacter flavus TaxID=150123 RepID=UPI003F140AE3
MTTAITHESLPWQSRISPDALPKRQRDLLREPYRAAITPPISGLDIDIDDDLVDELSEAQQLIVRFDTEVGHITAPFSSILLRSESASSSQIENLTSSAKAIAEAELDERDTGNAPLILANVRALEAALDASDELSNERIIAMQHQLLGASAPEITGRYRGEQVWIGGGNYSPHDADFVPPHHDRVPAAMDDFIAYSLRPAPLPLAAIAIAHAHFETIHPFPDGNGRTGRALVQAALRRTGLTRGVTVPISAGILQQRDAYFAALTSYRAGRVEPILRVFADGAFLAIGNGRTLVADIERIQADWRAALVGVRSDSAAHRITALALEHPVLNSRVVREHLDVSDRTMFSALDTLVDRGVLRVGTSRQRNRLWSAPLVLAALDGFAARSMRRG